MLADVKMDKVTRLKPTDREENWTWDTELRLWR